MTKLKTSTERLRQARGIIGLKYAQGLSEVGAKYVQGMSKVWTVFNMETNLQVMSQGNTKYMYYFIYCATLLKSTFYFVLWKGQGDDSLNFFLLFWDKHLFL